MHSLHSRQEEFAAALLDSSRTVPAGITGPDGRRSMRRFAVYRNNVVVGLVDALRDAYPAVCKLVGDEFFAVMAKLFVTQHPPQSPVLLEYGAGFAAFLRGFEPVRELVYLPDVASMERAWVESYHSHEAIWITAEALADVPQQDQATLKFIFHPSARVVRSDYPSLTIWRMNMEDLAHEATDLESGREDVLIVRPEAQVEVRYILQDQAVFFERLMQGASIVEAVGYVTSRFEAFDLSLALATLLEARALSGYEIQANGEMVGGVYV